MAAPSPIPDPRGPGRFHYAGVGGSGMSALAQFQVRLGGRASGSDRSFDQGGRGDAMAQLQAAGVALFPQDGSGARGDDVVALVVSTAVEDEVPDVAVARARGLPVVHRSELLARFVTEERTIAVSGTSGKSTVVAMLFEALSGAGRDPSVITGGDLEALKAEGLWGNAWKGRSDVLVVEADESDGSLVRYHPAIGVVLNLQKDHKPEAEVAEMFETFAAQAREALVVGEGANLAGLAERARRRGLPVIVFGFGPDADVRADASTLMLGPDFSTFDAAGTRFRLPVPGRHNVENALAAIAAGRALGTPPEALAEPLSAFRGVGRRFQKVATKGGVEVVDDFAHNPAKIEAALATARRRVAGRAGGGADARVLAIYQPHGYGPTRFLRDDFVDAFARALGPADRAWWLEVFYAGGTATRDFSAADIVADLAGRGGLGRRAAFARSREALVEAVAAEARPGDLVLVMGARDPSLTLLARTIAAALPEGR